ncbi:MAG TPA: dihydroorotate dehydrogenase [Candidatus Dormibacteraeota bacterium]|jgi:dihydroorotate dehydrogenase (NAD+) catalytic subunit|nr:dihydroorotate dehydrogenase [Candidatus Dormibacteraeota bacterium]
MSPALSVVTGGISLKGPVMAASGTFGYGTEVPLLDRAALGGMVSKGVTLRPRQGAPPSRIVETPSGMINAIGLQNPGVDAVIADYAPKWAAWDFPVLVNVNGETVDEYAEVARRLDGVPGVAGIELNISCPNVEAGGMWFGNDPASAAAVTQAVRRASKLPLWVKLTPNVTDIAAIARAVESVGADAISAVNTFTGMSIDLHTGQPRLANRSGGLSGPAIRPAALYLAYQAVRAVAIPVIGIGGISTAEDALEFLYAGCSAVQVGTATFVNPRAIANIHQGLIAHLSHKGVVTLAELSRIT